MINICKIMDSFSFSHLIVLRAFLLYVHSNKITVGIMVVFFPPSRHPRLCHGCTCKTGEKYQLYFGC